MHRYEEIEAYVMDMIRNGTLKEGDQIPRETELAELFHTSRPTVRQALSKLTLNGTITRIKGKGSFVQHTKLEQEYTRFISSYRAELQKKGLNPRTIVVSLEEICASEPVAHKLNLEEGAPVIKLCRLRFASDDTAKRPVVLTTVYIPKAMCPQLLEIDFRSASLYDTLESFGLAVTHVLREIEIRTAVPKISRRLMVKDFSPLFFISSIGRIADGRVIEYSESYYPSDTSKFIVEITR